MCKYFFCQRKIHLRRCVIRRALKSSSKRRWLFLSIFVFPPRESGFQKNPKSFFCKKCSFSETEYKYFEGEHIDPDEHSTNREEPTGTTWLLRGEARSQGLGMWLPHALHLSKKGRLREGTLWRGELNAENESQPQSWLAAISIFSVCGSVMPTAKRTWPGPSMCCRAVSGTLLAS